MGLDYGAVLAFAGLRPMAPGSAELLAWILPEVEVLILRGLRSEGGE